MIRRHRLAMAVTAAFIAHGVGERSLPAVTPDQEQRVAELRTLGGTVFERDGVVVEVNLNRTGVTDEDLGQLSAFDAMTGWARTSMP